MNLLQDIRAFCDRHQMPTSRFGVLALNDKPFVAQLERGRRVWPETEAKVRAFMESHETLNAMSDPVGIPSQSARLGSLSTGTVESKAGTNRAV